MIGSRIGSVRTLYGSSVGSASDDESASRILVVQFGQSNAQSHDLASNLSAANSAIYATPRTSVPMISNQDQTFGDDPMVWQSSGPQALQYTTYNAGGGPFPFLGFELSLMRDLDIAKPNGFAHVRVAVGGSSMLQWSSGSTYPTLPGGTANLPTQCITYIRNAMALMGCSSVVLVWEQGESDAKTIPLGTAYQAALEAFIDYIRGQLGPVGPGNTVVPFVYGKLNADADIATYPGLSQLRASQVAVTGTRSRVTLVNQDSLSQATGKYDGTHYNANGYIDLGHLFSPAVAAYCGIRVQPVSSFTYVPTALSVAFTDTSTSPGDTIVSWLWNFGDSTTSTTQSPTHVYAGSGTYSVTLKVTNSAGDTNTSAITSVPVVSGIAGVTRDALSAWYVPASTSEWTTFNTAIASGMSTPDALWDFQAASGNVSDLAGTTTLTAANTPAYQVAVSNWTRKAIVFADGTAKGLSSAVAALPDLSTTSMLVLLYVLMPSSTPALTRNIVELGTSAATRADVQITNTPRVQVQSTTTNAATGTVNPCDGTVHLVMLEINRTGTTVIAVTEAEKLVPTFGTGMTGKGIHLGTTGVGNASFGGGILYGAAWYGAKAEQTSTTLKTLANGLTGLTIPWS